MADPFQPGERVLFVDDRNRTYLVRLQAKGQFHFHGGAVAHDDVLGHPEGTVVRSRSDERLVCYRPRMADFVLKMPRGAQVLYPKDLAMIVTYADVFPGARVLEAGTGSGALTIALCRATGSTGTVVSCEVRPEFQAKAEENLSEFFGGLPAQLELRAGWLQDAVTSDDRFDRVILDMPEPWRPLEAIDGVLVPGGVVCGYVPTTGQSQTFVGALEAHGYRQIMTFESLVRTWYVTERSVRPDHRMVAHTGFITVARASDQRPED